MGRWGVPGDQVPVMYYGVGDEEVERGWNPPMIRFGNYGESNVDWVLGGEVGR